MTKKVELPNFASEIRALVGEGRSIPPVETWHPEREGEIDIRIAKDGIWYYQGEPMERESVVQLFATILRKDGDAYFLVTPAEKMKIQVDDAPFVVRMLDIEGEGRKQKLHCSTNVGECLTMNTEHPLEVELNEKGEPAPYLKVRSNLKALLIRSVYYELAELAVEDENDGERFGVWSDGEFFHLM